jgi:uncharacterized protein
MFILDPLYFVFLAPAIILMLWAQWRVKSQYARAMEVPTDISGAAAARRILDEAGLQDVGIEQVGGTLSDHYDPRHKVLRLSSDVYHQRTAAAVGIAAHEAGHALQDAENYAPLVIRNAAVPAAQFGPIWFFIFLGLGIFIPTFFRELIWIGIIGFSMVAVFQIINLPVEFDASNRAKRLLYDMGMVDAYGGQAVAGVLNAAAWTYVAATLQAILTVMYYVIRFGGLGRSD